MEVRERAVAQSAGELAFLALNSTRPHHETGLRGGNRDWKGQLRCVCHNSCFFSPSMFATHSLLFVASSSQASLLCILSYHILTSRRLTNICFCCVTGTVIKCKQRSTGQTVAMKMMDDDQNNKHASIHGWHEGSHASMYTCCSVVCSAV